MTTKTVATGITRFDLDDKNIHGFMVRMCRKGKHINEFFSDARCGGKRKARKSANERYDELLDEYGPAEKSTKGLLTKRNTSGIVGVHLARNTDKRSPNCEYWAYCASWTNEDQTRSKINFSWNKYGEKEALELASLARKHESRDREFIIKKHARQQADKLRRTRAKQVKLKRKKAKAK